MAGLSADFFCDTEGPSGKNSVLQGAWKKSVVTGDNKALIVRLKWPVFCNIVNCEYLEYNQTLLTIGIDFFNTIIFFHKQRYTYSVGISQ